MVIFLPSFVFSSVHLIWFSTGLFPLQLSGSQRPKCHVWQIHSFLLPICEWRRALITVPLFQTVLRRFFPPLLKELGWSLMRNSLPNVQSLLNHSALSIYQSNYDVHFQLFYLHLMLVCWSGWDTLKRSYFGEIRCLPVIKKCFTWFSQGCLHGLRK